MDVHGKVIMECLLETKAATILEFIQGLKGTLALTFEEGTSAAWLHDLLKPQVSRLVVCDPRRVGGNRLYRRPEWSDCFGLSLFRPPTLSRNSECGEPRWIRETVFRVQNKARTGMGPLNSPPSERQRACRLS